MAIMDDIRKIMLERASQGIGTGGGIFGATNQQGQPMGLLGGMQNINPNLLIGASIAGAGLQGKDPFSSILPAVAQTAQIQKLFTPNIKSTKKVFDKKTQSNVFATDLQIQKNPERYVPPEAEPENAAKVTRELEKEFRGLYKNSPIVKNFDEANTQLNKLISGAEQDSAAGDLSMIFTYMKVLDPTSVVREGEQATAQNAAGISSKVRNLYNKLLTGERLTEDQRKDFVSSGINLFKANTRSLDTFREGFVKTFKNKNINPSDIFMDSDFRPDKISVNGQEIDLPRGTILDNFDISTGEYIYLLPTGQRFKLKR